MSPLSFYIDFHSFLNILVGSISSRLVTLGSIEIFNAHEWLPSKPIVYFSCKGENKTILPDVKATDFLYSFKGQESWQVSCHLFIYLVIDKAYHYVKCLIAFL